MTAPRPLAAAYFDYQQKRNESDSWAWEAVNLVGFDDPIGKWTQILALLSAAPDDWAIGLLAAGPLEDLLSYHGAAVVDLVEHEARTNARLRSALAGVWLEPGPTAERVGAHPGHLTEGRTRARRERLSRIALAPRLGNSS